MKKLIIPKKNFSFLDLGVFGIFFIFSITLKIIYFSLYGVNIGCTLNQPSYALFAIAIAPLVETILFNVLLTALFLKLKLKTAYTILLVSFIFALAHIFNDLIYPVLIFIPCFFMSWCYIHYLKRHGFLVAFALTVLLHSLYNITASIY